MKPDEEGFLYPVVDKSGCVECNACSRCGADYACDNLVCANKQYGEIGCVFKAFLDTYDETGGSNPWIHS